MQPGTDKRIVLVVRRTRLADLIARFNTEQQARFYVEHLGADFSDYQREDAAYQAASTEAVAILGTQGRLHVLNRDFLPNYLFGPDDTVVVLGQDGLVANTVKYLAGQPVVGVNPDPARWDGVLLPFQVCNLRAVMPEVLHRRRPTRSVTMAQARLNNGQSLYAVNDLFIGPKTHGSARYGIRLGTAGESQSSSGIIVSTGLGSTGWYKSIVTGTLQIASSLEGRQPGGLPDPSFPWDARSLRFSVREPFPSRTSSATLVHGVIDETSPLELTSLMPENGVIFSDGIERDFLEFNSGTVARIGIADKAGCLVV